MGISIASSKALDPIIPIEGDQFQDHLLPLLLLQVFTLLGDCLEDLCSCQGDPSGGLHPETAVVVKLQCLLHLFMG